MVLTSPRAYNFNCAPQSSQYLYSTKIFIHELFCILYPTLKMDMMSQHAFPEHKCFTVDCQQDTFHFYLTLSTQ